MRPALHAVAVAAVVTCTLAGSELAGTTLASGAAGSAALARPVAHARRRAGPQGVEAVAGDLVNASTGQSMWSRGLDDSYPIASITKVMTAMVVIGNDDLTHKITVTEAAEQYAINNDADSAGLVTGDVLTIRQLLEGMLLPSGADAAYLLAHNYPGGWRAFVREMNATARKLGMTQTHFANFDGLPWPTEYTTYSSPRDVMIMAKAAMKLALFRQIVREQHYFISATKTHHQYYWKNTNLLLGSYPGAIGIKTGFTLAAGYCLLFAAVRGGRELMGVVLDSTNTDPSIRFSAAAALLNWGFAGLSGSSPLRDHARAGGERALARAGRA